MNPVAVIHLILGGIMIAAAVPLIRRKVKMNPWYGVRIPAAFASEARWFEINHYGGKLLFIWGNVIAATALIGIFLRKDCWSAYNWSALVVIGGGLLVVIWKIYRHAAMPRSVGGKSPPNA